MNKGFVDYYEILEIDPTNDLKLIKKAYKRLAKLTHPDVNGTGDDTEFKKIQNAYDVLNSEEVLKKYYNYYQKHKEKVRKDNYEVFRKQYEEYVVNKPTEYAKKHRVNNIRPKKKRSKINVFFNNLKKDKYILRTAKVVGMITAIAIIVNMANIKKQNNDNVDDTPIQPVNTIVNEENLTYELIRNYEVQKGDTLYDLSIETGIPVEKIKEINNLEDDTIYYNKTIKLPYEVDKENLDYYTNTVNVENNSIYDLAEKYNTTTETIYNLNREAIVSQNGNYYVLSDSLKVPNFISKSDLDVLKNYEKSKSLVK